VFACWVQIVSNNAYNIIYVNLNLTHLIKRVRLLNQLRIKEPAFRTPKKEKEKDARPLNLIKNYFRSFFSYFGPSS